MYLKKTIIEAAVVLENPYFVSDHLDLLPVCRSMYFGACASIFHRRQQNRYAT